MHTLLELKSPDSIKQLNETIQHGLNKEFNTQATLESIKTYLLQDWTWRTDPNECNHSIIALFNFFLDLGKQLSRNYSLKKDEFEQYECFLNWLMNHYDIKSCTNLEILVIVCSISIKSAPVSRGLKLFEQAESHYSRAIALLDRLAQTQLFETQIEELNQWRINCNTNLSQMVMVIKKWQKYQAVFNELDRAMLSFHSVNFDTPVSSSPLYNPQKKPSNFNPNTISTSPIYPSKGGLLQPQHFFHHSQNLIIQEKSTIQEEPQKSDPGGLKK